MSKNLVSNCGWKKHQTTNLEFMPHEKEKRSINQSINQIICNMVDTWSFLA